MPATTACAGFPYPVDLDPIDVAGDIKKLADAVDARICAQVAMPVGTIFPWWDNGGSIPAGLVRCNGQAFNGVALPELAAHLGTTVMPDLRQRFLRGSGGNFPTNGQMSGWADAVVVSHDHVMGSHTHSIDHGHAASNSGTISADHSHGFNVDTNATGSHLHNMGYNVIVPYVLYGGGGLTIPGGSGWNTSGGWGANNDNGHHAHNVSGGTGGVSSNHTHAVNVPTFYGGSGGPSASSTVATGVAGTNRNLPPFVNVTYLMKATST